MAEAKDSLKNTPLSSVDNHILNADHNNSFKDIEEQRFTTYNPLLSNSIKFKRMYWSSGLEILARSLLLLVSCLHVFFAYFLVDHVFNKILISYVPNIKSIYIIYISLVIALGFNFLFYLPIAIGRTANAMFAWSIIYIILAIAYFITLEIMCTMLLVINGLVDEPVSDEIPIFMVISLVITIIWLIASCILIVKCDDVRRELSVE